MSGSKIHAIYADPRGKLQVDSDLIAVGLNGDQVEPAAATWIDLPAGGDLMLLPGRLPLGFNENSGALEVAEASEAGPVTAVAAILPVGLTRCLLPGYEIDDYQELPLFGYTAVGSDGDRLKVAAVRTDADLKWNPVYYNTPDLPGLIAKKRGEFPENRILRQLARCAEEYHCLTAQNIFYERWEAGIPVSPVCNASCMGCISRQPAECCPAPQSRIKFIPTISEVVSLAAGHLERAGDAIVSFGQGCEGEPSLQADLLEPAIRSIRERTSSGTININSNAGATGAIRRLVDAGLDGIRVSLFSARPENYCWYHQPSGYDLAAVEHSAAYAAEHGVNVALNLLLYPGFTNHPAETEALYGFLTRTGVRQIQLRNLNLDPEWLTEKLTSGPLPGITEWLDRLKENFPGLAVGNYTQPRSG